MAMVKSLGTGVEGSEGWKGAGRLKAEQIGDVGGGIVGDVGRRLPCLER